MQDCVSIKVMTLGEQATNCYIVWSKQTHEGYVIDPADEGDAISQVLLKENIALKGILLTHGHFDHLLALLELQLNYPVPVYLHPDDLFLIERASTTAHHFLGRAVDPIPTKNEPISHDQIFPIGSTHFKAIHTPGHTPGSVCFFLKANKSQLEIEQLNTSNNDILFTGDTLFSYGIESISHQYSSALELNQSLDVLDNLGEAILILPGHGESAPLTSAIKNRNKTPLVSY